jgi:hypothetical protein
MAADRDSAGRCVRSVNLAGNRICCSSHRANPSGSFLDKKVHVFYRSVEIIHVASSFSEIQVHVFCRFVEMVKPITYLFSDRSALAEKFLLSRQRRGNGHRSVCQLLSPRYAPLGVVLIWAKFIRLQCLRRAVQLPSCSVLAFVEAVGPAVMLMLHRVARLEKQPVDGMRQKDSRIRASMH